MRCRKHRYTYTYTNIHIHIHLEASLRDDSKLQDVQMQIPRVMFHKGSASGKDIKGFVSSVYHGGAYYKVRVLPQEFCRLCLRRLA